MFYLNIFITIFLASCAGKAADFNSKEPLPEYDYYQGQARLGASAVVADNAVYYIDPLLTRDKYYLNYFDKLSGLSGPLCNRPECTHSYSSLSAFVGVLIIPVSSAELMLGLGSGKLWYATL